MKSVEAPAWWQPSVFPACAGRSNMSRSEIEAMSRYECISPSQVLLQYLLALESLKKEEAATAAPSMRLEIPVIPGRAPVDYAASFLP